MHSLPASKSLFKALSTLASSCGLLADSQSRLTVGLALPQITLNCLLLLKHSSTWLWSSVWSSLCSLRQIDFRFQANFLPQVINHTIIHVDSDSFGIPFEVIFELREELLCLIQNSSELPNSLLRSGRKTGVCTGYSSSTYRKLSIDRLVRCSFPYLPGSSRNLLYSE